MVDDTTPDAGGRARPDPTAELKVRARRRLIGAAALLLAVIVIVPAVLDPTPKPLSSAIPIEIPSEKTPFTPRLSLPALPEVVPGPAPEATSATDVRKGETAPQAATPKRAPVAVAPTPDKVAEAKLSDKRAAAPKTAAPNASDSKGTDTADADAKRARDLLEGRTEGVPDTWIDPKGRFVLQAAASSSETAARELAGRIAASGHPSFIEKFEAKDGVRYRVRLGPFGSRDDAERARARLRAIGVNSNVVAL